MDLLQRLQPLDVLFAILWAAIVGWGLQSGVVRQLGMLVGVYAAAVVAGSAYRPASQALALALGGLPRPVLEFTAYLALFSIVFGMVGLIVWRAYPTSRLAPAFGLDNLLGAVVAAVWGVLLLIVVLTILRFYGTTPFGSSELDLGVSQRDVLRQVQLSQVAPVLEVVTWPLWQLMQPWFPRTG